MPNWPRRPASPWARSRAGSRSRSATCWAAASAWPCWWRRRIRPSIASIERVEHALIGLAVNRGAAMRGGQVALEFADVDVDDGRRARARRHAAWRIRAARGARHRRRRGGQPARRLVRDRRPGALGARRRGPVVGVRLGARLRRHLWLAKEGPTGVVFEMYLPRGGKRVMAETNAEAPVRTDPRYPASAVSGDHLHAAVAGRRGEAGEHLGERRARRGQDALRAGHARDGDLRGPRGAAVGEGARHPLPGVGDWRRRQPAVSLGYRVRGQDRTARRRGRAPARAGASPARGAHRRSRRRAAAAAVAGPLVNRW